MKRGFTPLFVFCRIALTPTETGFIQMIKISQTYEIITEESAIDGDAAERGFDFENADYSFRELVEYIEFNGFYHSSNSHGVPGWLTTEVIQDRAFFEDGENRTLSLHPGKDAMSQKYWEKACRVAGFKF